MTGAPPTDLCGTARREGLVAAPARTLLLAAAAWISLSGCVDSSTRPSTPAPPPSPAPLAPAFRDVTREAGIDFRHFNGGSKDFYLHEIMSGGGGFLDYDGDGWLDIYLVQGCRYAEPDPARGSRLYRNRRDGTFEDVTAKANAGASGYGFGCAAADYDRDGDVDLFVTRLGTDDLRAEHTDVLLRNDGRGRFEDVSPQALLGASPGLSTSAAWVDYDGDGWLDLFVCRYLRWNLRLNKQCRGARTHHVDYCNPTAYEKVPSVLYRNQRDGTLRNVSKESGVHGVPGYALAVACSDFDRDGRTDIFVATDQSGCQLWRSLGDGSLREDSTRFGCRANGSGDYIAGMGVVCEDFDGDLDFDLGVTNLRNKPILFLRRETGVFHDVTARWSEAGWSRRYTGFGLVAVDHDLDGALEIFIANGAVNTHYDPFSESNPYAEPNLLLAHGQGGRFTQAPLPAAIAAPAVSRAAASADYDRDGDVDLLICRNGDAPQLLRNDAEPRRHWLVVEVVAEDSGSPVLNSRVTIRSGARRAVREIRAQQSYLSSCEPVAHFGLGDAQVVDEVTVELPGGGTLRAEHVPADQRLVLRAPAAPR